MDFIEVNGKNWKRELKELDISKYPSMPTYIKDVRTKLLKKQELTLMESRITLPKLKKYFEEFRKEFNKLYLEKVDWDEFNHRPPKDFQKLGIEFMIKHDRCINADDMGLGKSIQAIIAAKSLPDNWNILVITTKSLKYNFASEIEHFDSRYSIIDKEWKPDKFTIVHYDSIKKWQTDIIECRFDIVIIDECHKLRNIKTNRFQLLNKVFVDTKKDIKKMWLLTGTPISNRPYDFYNLLKLCKHKISDNWKTYVEKYCNGYIDVVGRWDIKGASNLEELHEKTKDIIIRRKKTEILENFPNKYRRSILLKLPSFHAYNQTIKDYRKGKVKILESEGIDTDNFKVNSLTKLVLWRQFCALEKLKDGSLLDLIENEIDKGNKIIVATNFTAVVDFLHDKLGSKLSCILDGRIKDPAERLRIVEDFNRDDDKKVFIGNMKVVSVGYNITSANCVIVNDMSWNPDDMEQTEDRSWRMGQERDVDVIYPLYYDTVEEDLYQMIVNKSKITSTIIDGKEKGYFEGEEEKTSSFSMKDLLSKIDSINI